MKEEYKIIIRNIKNNFKKGMYINCENDCVNCPISNRNVGKLWPTLTTCGERPYKYGFYNYKRIDCQQTIKFWKKIAFSNTLMETE